MRADRTHEPRENEERWNTAGSFGQGKAREAFDDVWFILKEEALIRIDEERCGRRPPFAPQRAPDALGQSISDFLARCRQLEMDCIREHEQKCSDRAALAEKQRLAAAAARPTSLAATDGRRHGADMQCREYSSVNLTLVEERRRLADAHQRHDVSSRAAALAARSIAEERGRHDTLARALDLAERALAEERCRHDASARATALAELALAEERLRADEDRALTRIAAARARQEEAARARQEEANARAADRARQEATARARQEEANACATARARQEEAAARANEAARTIFLWLRRRRLHARLVASLAVAVLADTRLCPQTAEARSPDLGPAEIWRIQAARDTLAAPLDALLADFAALAVGTASPATASPVPTPSPRPRSYLDAVVGPNGRGYTSSAPPSPSVTTSHPSASAPPTPTVYTTHRAKPRHRTGRRNIPRAPSSFVAVAPTHPELLPGGLPTPTFITLARATSLCRSVVSSPPHAPSLHPFTFDDGTILSSGGGNAHPFRARGLPLPPWKRTRRKYRPHRTCRRHQPRAPNQSTGWA